MDIQLYDDSHTEIMDASFYLHLPSHVSFKPVLSACVYIVQCWLCTWNKKHLLISSAMEHLLPVQARLAEHSSWCCQALKLKASLVQDCSGKRCKADGLVKRETHGRLCVTSALCYLMLLPGLLCRTLCGGKDVSQVNVWFWLSTLYLSTQTLDDTFVIITL